MDIKQTSFKEILLASQQFAERKLTFDSRYKNIVGHLDAMLEQLIERPNKDLGANFDQLLDNMLEHIGNENSYIGMVGFPYAEPHYLNHRFISIKVAELRHRSIKCREMAPEELSYKLSYVRNLWLEHIKKYDRVFEEFLVS